MRQFFAFTGTTIAQHMVSFANMSTHRRSEFSKSISSWAYSVFNPDTAFNKSLMICTLNIACAYIIFA